MKLIKKAMLLGRERQTVLRRTINPSRLFMIYDYTNDNNSTGAHFRLTAKRFRFKMVLHC